jgi:hypothetical protein
MIVEQKYLKLLDFNKIKDTKNIHKMLYIYLSQLSQKYNVPVTFSLAFQAFTLKLNGYDEKKIVDYIDCQLFAKEPIEITYDDLDNIDSYDDLDSYDNLEDLESDSDLDKIYSKALINSKVVQDLFCLGMDYLETPINKYKLRGMLINDNWAYSMKDCMQDHSYSHLPLYVLQKILTGLRTSKTDKYKYGLLFQAITLFFDFTIYNNNEFEYFDRFLIKRGIIW